MIFGYTLFFDNRVKIYVTTEISRPIRAKNRTGYP